MNLRLDLRSLQLFVSVVELQSLTKTAEHQNIATSAISKRISDLEIALDSTLLYRQARGVEPTPAGLALYTHARTVLSSVERLVGELTDYANGSKGHVRISANKSSILQGLPEELSAFSDMHPEVKLALEEDISPNILRSVHDGRADLGVFTFGQGDTLGLEVFEYRQDSLLVVLPRTHPLSTRPRLRFSEVLQHDVVNLDSVTAWNDLLKQYAEQVGATLRIRYRVSSFDVMCAVVAAGLGLAITPRAVLGRMSDPRLKGIPLDEDWAERRHLICVRHLEALPPPARLMLNHLLPQFALDGSRRDRIRAVGS